MKRKLSYILGPLILGCLLTIYSPAQYYYRDLVTLQQNLDQFQKLKSNKVSRVELMSFESNGAPSEGFNCEQQVNRGFTQVKTITKTELNGGSSLTNYYNMNGLLVRSLDSSKESLTTYQYNYDSTGQVVEITNTSNGYGDKTKTYETHKWFYNDQGKPVRMYRIREKSDTTIVEFKIDSLGNVVEERSKRENTPIEDIYYYYDPMNRLTDVVRYHQKLDKLLPDYLFDYDSENRLAKMVSIQDGGLFYLIWLYEYNDKGLKNQEKCYDKSKKLVGKIEYRYEYR